MPTVSSDTVNTVQNFDVDDLLYASSGGSGGNNTIRINGTSEIVSRRELVHVDMADSYEIPVTDGYIRYGHYEGAGPAYTTQEIQRVTQDAVDSNTSIIKRSTIKQPYNTNVDSTTGKMTVSGSPKSGSFAANAAYYLTEINQAILAAQVGIALGKGIDAALYNANPNFWDSAGMKSLDPSTWGQITLGDTSFGASLFNSIFGINPETGEAQAYVDANAFAYMALYQNNLGLFAPSIPEVMSNTIFNDSGYMSNVNYPYSAYPVNSVIQTYKSGQSYNYLFVSRPCYLIVISPAQQNIGLGILVSDAPFTCGTNSTTTPGVTPTPSYSFSSSSYTYDDKTVYYYNIGGIYSTSFAENFLNLTGTTKYTNAYPNMYSATFHEQLAYTYLYGSVSSEPIEGITDQTGATKPNTSDWTDVASTLASLMQQFPDLFANALTYAVPDATGTLIDTVYVPVAWPQTAANPWTDVQPTTDTATQTQTQTKVNLKTEPTTRVDTLTNTLTQPVNTNPNGQTPPSENPTNTGSGSSPVPVSTSGNSSKLWSVYHPTQAQVDAFGSWLWSTNFIDQIMKMFQNPMEGIISLHKVFATPIDAGTGNIIVGTLDSGVSSATVTQQYVYVSCGSVDCHEDFGNVFDYSPHTQVSLYLPFIGIVPLDVSDVMRSTITIEYGVDMFTGACLAMVKVSRDNDTVNMYQYAGSASVEYPLSNVQQSQLLSGILAVAAGGAAIATGGAAIPASLAIVGGVANTMKSNVGRSGGFSGNAGAMGIKKPYLIIQRPQTKVAGLFPRLAGYPTNISGQLSDFSGQVKVTDVHVEGIPATDVELTQIEELLHSGVLV